MNTTFKKTLLLLVMIVSIVACGGKQEGSNTDSTDQETGGKSKHKNEKIAVAKTAKIFAIGKGEAEVKVSSVTMDFFPEGKIVLLGDDKQVVRFELEITNNNDEEYSFNNSTVRLNTNTEKDKTLAIIINKSNSDDVLASAKIAKGNSIKGAMYYEVPKSVTLKDLTLVFKGYDAKMKAQNIEIPFAQ
ncbi:MAG TPA: hypothetical protein DCS93_21025 [Microscillaceae bacterium]|nr:hypothetical protein [Microscillaceae bacterium]